MKFPKPGKNFCIVFILFSFVKQKSGNVEMLTISIVR